MRSRVTSIACESARVVLARRMSPLAMKPAARVTAWLKSWSCVIGDAPSVVGVFGDIQFTGGCRPLQFRARRA